MPDDHQLLKHGRPLGQETAYTEQSPSGAERALHTKASYSTGQCSARLPKSPDCRECLSALTHRLAQPMTALRGGIELGLLGKRSIGDYRSLLEQSLQLADQLAQMIISLRDLGESGAPCGNPQCLRLETAVEEILIEVEGLAQARDLRLELHADGAFQVTANPDRLREALQNLLTWVIQNSAGPGVVNVTLARAAGEVHILLSPPRLDLQYLQIKALEDIMAPGILFSHAVKRWALGWAINQRLVDGLSGKLEIAAGGPEAGCIRVVLPLPPSSAGENPS